MGMYDDPYHYYALTAESDNCKCKLKQTMQHIPLLMVFERRQTCREQGLIKEKMQQ